MNKLVKIIIVLILVALITVGGFFAWYNSSISAVDKNNHDEIVVEIPIGSTADSIAKVLKDKNLIKNVDAFKLYVKMNKVSNFQAGTYSLTKSMSVEELTKTLQTGKLYTKNQVSITFIEGTTMREFAKKIASNTNNTEEDVFNLLKDTEYIDSLINKYWFITDEIKNSDIYYPLEGYLYPDTYFFENKDVTVKKIFEDLLNQMDSVLKEYKTDIENSKYTMHEILSLASVIEKEGGHSAEDSAYISGVLYNRLAKNMALQADATTYYAFNIEMGSRDLKMSELNTYNPYNTRGPKMEGKLPIGPISSVTKTSIEAALKPKTTNYLYYVSDKNGKFYFTETYAEHDKMIAQLKSQGLWYEYK